jgi:ABC-type branched-subunit amino acid transport system permease subunit
VARENPVLALVRIYWTPLALALILLAITVLVWLSGDGVLARTLTDAWIRAVLVVGLYIFIGNAGVLVFGHIAFTLIGAYATAWLTLSVFKKSFALKLPALLASYQYPVFPSAIASAALAALVALIVGFPIMRLSGLAASIASLAVLGMFHTFYTNWSPWTMGAATLPGVPLYVNMWVALGWLVAALIVAFVYQRSRFGLALRAAREDEVAARAAGIDIAWQRLIAFVISAFFMGIGGVLQAHFIGSIAVKSFWLALTFLSLAMLIVGGQRSLTGAVVGAVTISAIVEVLRQLEEGVQLGTITLSVPLGAEELGVAVLMLLILIFRPSGIMGGREIPSPFEARRRARFLETLREDAAKPDAASGE